VRAGTTSDAALLSRLGLRVKVLRTHRRMSQEDLAQAAALDRTYVSRVERGAHNITVLTLIRIAEALNLAPGELLDSAVDDDDRVTGLPTRRRAEAVSALPGPSNGANSSTARSPVASRSSGRQR
jgi:transcriptional regulator with XRE-family HTH domain